MTHRVPIRCKNCSEVIALRVVVAGVHQPFVFACPHCTAPLRGTFFARLEQMELRIESEDFDKLDVECPDSVAVAVATDLPVHLGLFGATGSAAKISPFLVVSQELGLERAKSVVHDGNRLRAIRERLFPAVRRAAAFWADRNLAGLSQALEAVPGSQELDWENETPMALFDELVGSLYGPLELPNVREACAEELLRFISRALDEHVGAFTALFDEFEARPLEEHRRRITSAVFGALGDVDAFLPALWAEAMAGRVDLAPYRVMRDDFATRRSSYQELFELASRTLAFTAPIANLVLRGDARAFADGKTRSPEKARAARAFERTEWLVDFPLTKPRYEAVSRHTRNDIGHALVRQDVRRGVLVYADGSEQNYILFLVDWLNAVRLGRYALDVIVILDYTRSALRQRNPP